MKKLLLSAFVFAGMFLSAKAQEGSILVFGNLGYNNTSFGDVKSNNFNFNPGVGYQLNNSWTAGLEFGIGSTKETMPNHEHKTSNFFCRSFRTLYI